MKVGVSSHIEIFSYICKILVYNHTEVIFLKRIIENLIRSNLFDYEQIGYDDPEIESVIKNIN